MGETAQSEYYDPDTGIFHSMGWNHDSLAANSTDQFEVGFGVDSAIGVSTMGIRFKVLSIEFKLKITNNYINADEFYLAAHDSYGDVHFGIINDASSSTDFDRLNKFDGTSGWPVACQGYHAVPGNPASISKTWKPKKLAVSNEQVAFINLDTGVNSYGVIYLASIYLRGIRL